MGSSLKTNRRPGAAGRFCIQKDLKNKITFQVKVLIIFDSNWRPGPAEVQSFCQKNISIKFLLKLRFTKKSAAVHYYFTKKI